MSIVHDIDESGCTRRMSVVHDFDESDSIADSEPDHPFSMIQPHWSALYPDVKFERPPLPVIPQQIKEANPAYSGINTPRPPATTRPMIGTLTSPKTPKRSSARNILRHLSMSSRKPHKKEASKREKYAPMTTPPLAPRNSNSMDLSWRLSRDRKETVLIGARVEDLEQVPETPSRKMKGYIGRAKSIRWPNSPENHK